MISIRYGVPHFTTRCDQSFAIQDYLRWPTNIKKEFDDFIEAVENEPNRKPRIKLKRT